MEIKVPLAEQGLEEDDIKTAMTVLLSGLHTMGARVEEFEQAFADYIGVKNAVMVNSGSSANLLALQALNYRKKKESSDSAKYVAIPAVLWPTSLWPIVQSGFIPLFLDSAPGQVNIDLDLLFRAKEEFGSQLVGAVLIHALGKSLDLTRVKELIDEDFFVVEDTCESLGAGYQSKIAGSVGNFGTFSFYFSHHITTIEGGMVVTNSDQDADALRSLRAHGWIRERRDRESIVKSQPTITPDFLFIGPGYNLRPMELQAALGLSQLKRLPTFLKRRVDVASQVDGRSLSQNVALIANSEDFTQNNQGVFPHTWMTLPFLAKSEEMRIKARRVLGEHGVATRPIIAGNFLRQPAEKTFTYLNPYSLTNADIIHQRGFMVGNHHNFSDEQVDILISALNEI